MDKLYASYLKILDGIRREAPDSQPTYHVGEDRPTELVKARSRALTHLLLKVRFGILSFNDREELVTDASYDGGIDGYYIDETHRRIYFIQTKFRASADNFYSKNIGLDELLAMDIGRITRGETQDANGNRYNGKILGLIRKISEIRDIGRWDYRVIIIANLRDADPERMSRLIGGFEFDVYDAPRILSDCVFPVVSGTSYRGEDLTIGIDLDSRNHGSSRITYFASTEAGNCTITVVFVPTIEIAKIVSRFRNSILQHNPRSYLDLSDNEVNPAITASITEKSTNEFAIFNNGITMLATEALFNERTGQRDKAQLFVSNPQIINGGQTAYTLSKLYESLSEEDELPRRDVFASKEVLLKVVTFDDEEFDDPEVHRVIIEDISKATNHQTAVTEADRRSNDKLHVELQEYLFHHWGEFYERKRGEFGDGVAAGYLEDGRIIRRDNFMRVANACKGRPSRARRSGEDALFKLELFKEMLESQDRWPEYYYGYRVLMRLFEIQRVRREGQDLYRQDEFGGALRYGKYAVVAAASRYFRDGGDEFGDFSRLGDVLELLLGAWLEFEVTAKESDTEGRYFTEKYDPDTGELRVESNWDGYYKGRTVDADIDAFFGPEVRPLVLE